MRRFATMLALAVVFVLPASAQTTFDVNIRQIFAVHPDSVAKAEQLQTTGTITGAIFERLTRSPYTDRRAPVDTLVRFTAVLLTDPLNSGLASVANGRVGRVHVFVRDVAALNGTTVQPGFVAQVVDGAYDTDGLLQLAPGAVIRITGSIAYFSNQPQISPTSIELIARDYRTVPYPASIVAPITVPITDLNKPATPLNGEPQATLNFANFPRYAYEYVRLEGLRVETNDVAGTATTRFNMTFANPQRTSFIFASDVSLRFRNDRNTDATYRGAGFNVRNTNFVPPAVGATVNLQGFTQPYTADFVNKFNPNLSINISPFEDADLQVTASPPSVANLRTASTVVRGTAAETVTADVVVDPQRTLTGVSLFYRVAGTTAYTQVAATAGTATPTSTPYSAQIPASVLANGAFIEYYFRATDNTGGATDAPARTFRVLANGIRKIEDIQRTATGGAADSPFRNVVLSGTDFQLNAVVMSQPDSTGFVTIQDDAGLAPFSGIFLESTAATQVLRKGDQIQITGATVTETSGETRLTGLTFTKTGTTTAYGYKALSTADIATDNTREPYEGMAIRLANVTVASANPDAPSNFGEFTVYTTSAAASTALRVDDRATSLFNKGFNSRLRPWNRFSSVQGILGYANSQFKLLPELKADLAGLITGLNEEAQAAGLSLFAPMPNPARGATKLLFQTATAAPAQLDVYDLMGRRVATLAAGLTAPGEHTATLSTTDLAAGVYIVRLAQGAAVATQTLVVVK